MIAPATVRQVVADVAGIASTRDSPAQRAEALLAPLRRITPFDAALIALFDPERRRQVPLLRHGYGDKVRQFLTGEPLTGDVDRVGLQRPGRPLRGSDMPVPLDTLPTWSQCLSPAGYRETVGVALCTPDGRYLGLLGTHSESRRPASNAACALLHRLTPLIAHAVDPLRTITAVTDIVTDAVAAVVTTRAGNTMPLPGLPDHRLLAPASPVLTAVDAQLADGAVHAAFLCPTDDTQMLRVTALACPPLPPGHLRKIVLLSPPPPLHGLTRRELEVLGLLAEGWPSARIAATLAITVRTVSSHLEHILAKLAATSRTVAAVQALRQGVYIPRQLVPPRV
ncbi:MAG TPA: helix-turn-helix transcriptional regulator [Pilimelia sp.]|nr:helix-turn-helix transcriptional regulator [Pilimelia sp.]